VHSAITTVLTEPRRSREPTTRLLPRGNNSTNRAATVRERTVGNGTAGAQAAGPKPQDTRVQEPAPKVVTPGVTSLSRTVTTYYRPHPVSY